MNTMLIRTGILAILMLTIHAAGLSAHGDEHDIPDRIEAPVSGPERSAEADAGNNGAEEAESIGSTMASFDDFPTLHPLVVHFPIVFLIVALLTQIAGLFVYREAMGWVTFGALALGFLGAVIAGLVVHPHTHGLTPKAAAVLSEHEWFATVTLWTSGAALLAKGLSMFALERHRWIEIVVVCLLLGAAASVSLAGHHGAQLVHIEGIGPQGKYLAPE